MKDNYEFVKSILMRFPETRDDDMKLFARACWLKDKPVPTSVNLYHAFFDHDKYDLPSYESITRARRKVQEKEQALRGRRYKQRKEAEKEYRNHYSSEF